MVPFVAGVAGFVVPALLFLDLLNPQNAFWAVGVPSVVSFPAVWAFGSGVFSGSETFNAFLSSMRLAADAASHVGMAFGLVVAKPVALEASCWFRTVGM